MRAKPPFSDTIWPPSHRPPFSWSLLLLALSQVRVAINERNLQKPEVTTPIPDVCQALPLPSFAGHIEHGRSLQATNIPLVLPIYTSPRPYGYYGGYSAYGSPAPYTYGLPRPRRLQAAVPAVLPIVLPIYTSPRPYGYYGGYTAYYAAQTAMQMAPPRPRRLQTVLPAGAKLPAELPSVLPMVLPIYTSPRPYGYYAPRPGPYGYYGRSP